MTAPQPVRLAPPPAGPPACASHDPDLWFGADGEPLRDRAAREVKAKAICAGCPLRAGCLAGAKDRGEQFGIWGGEDFEHPGRRLCRNGLHLMTAANTYVNPGRGRTCRACRNAYEQRRAS